MDAWRMWRGADEVWTRVWSWAGLAAIFAVTAGFPAAAGRAEEVAAGAGRAGGAASTWPDSSAGRVGLGDEAAGASTRVSARTSALAFREVANFSSGFPKNRTS